MEAYLESIVKPFLQDPESLNIIQSQDQLGMLLTVCVSPRDMGRIIGKAGAHIQAVRTLIHMYGLANNAKISVKVLEPRGGLKYTAEDNTHTHG